MEIIQTYEYIWNWYMKGSIPICPIWSHSLVHEKNNSYYVGIEPLLKQELIKLFLWWYLFSACYFRRDQVLYDTYFIYNRYEINNDFIFLLVTMDFWPNYIS